MIHIAFTCSLTDVGKATGRRVGSSEVLNGCTELHDTLCWQRSFAVDTPFVYFIVSDMARYIANITKIEITILTPPFLRAYTG